MLDQLSVELVELILHSLDDSSFLAFRSVSRRLCRATYDLFAQRWFALLTTDFKPRSLRRLSHIAQNHEIASRVRCLRIADCYRNPIPSARALDLHHDDESGILGQQCPRGESGCLDLNSPQSNKLREMLLHFAQCTEICLTDDAEDKLWSQPAPDRLNPIDICCLMLSLLNKLQPQRFDVQFERSPIEKINSWPSSPELCNLLSQSSWASHLRQLSISWEFRESLIDVMIPLITSAAHLKSLTLCHPGYSDIDAFFTQLVCSPQLPALSELKLAECNRVSPAALSGFIARFQTTLESLWIENVTVAEDRFGDVLSQLATLDLPALKCITVANCFRIFFCPLLFNQHVMEQCGDGFEFTLRNFRRKGRVNGVRYRGRGDDMRLALSALGDSSYKLQSGGSEPDTPDMYSSAAIQAGRVVREFA